MTKDQPLGGKTTALRKATGCLTRLARLQLLRLIRGAFSAFAYIEIGLAKTYLTVLRGLAEKEQPPEEEP